jgi:WD40 repeat protein
VGRPLKGHEGRILTLESPATAAALAPAGEDGTVVLWDVDNRPLEWGGSAQTGLSAERDPPLGPGTA